MNDRENIRKILLIAMHDFNSNWKSHDEAYNGVTNSVNEIMKIVNSNYDQGYSDIKKFNNIKLYNALRHQSK